VAEVTREDIDENIIFPFEFSDDSFASLIDDMKPIIRRLTESTKDNKDRNNKLALLSQLLINLSKEETDELSEKFASNKNEVSVSEADPRDAANQRMEEHGGEVIIVKMVPASTISQSTVSTEAQSNMNTSKILDKEVTMVPMMSSASTVPAANPSLNNQTSTNGNIGSSSSMSAGALPGGMVATVQGQPIVISKAKLSDLSSKRSTSNKKPKHDKERTGGMRACPCCDPDNIDNLIDKMMFLDR
jgi:hypothetical protein